jgi:hypothetical protein
MAYLIKLEIVNEDTGACSTYTEANIYETKALAKYFASKVDYEYRSFVVEADNVAYIKAPRVAEVESEFYYGCPAHAAFGDRWFFGDDFYS